MGFKYKGAGRIRALDRKVAFEEFLRGTPFWKIQNWLEFREGKRPHRADLIEWWYDAGFIVFPPQMPERLCAFCMKNYARVSKRGAGIFCKVCMGRRKIARAVGFPYPIRFPVLCKTCQVERNSGFVSVEIRDGMVVIPWNGNFICTPCVERKRRERDEEE